MGSTEQRTELISYDYPRCIHTYTLVPFTACILAKRIDSTNAKPLLGLSVNGRVRLLPESDARRGTISYIGLVPEIPGIGVWIGVTLDEPTGKNDGSVKGKRYFECGSNYGVFVRPERCEAGDFPALDMGDEDLEEL